MDCSGLNSTPAEVAASLFPLMLEPNATASRKSQATLWTRPAKLNGHVTPDHAVILDLEHEAIHRLRGGRFGCRLNASAG
jgi:hypothetical protein